jgi:two-component system NtrC family sensor kinase
MSASTILIISADDALRDALQQQVMLADDQTWAEAQSLTEARAKITELRPLLAVLDCPPDEAGYRQFLSDYRWQVPMVAMLARPSVADVLAALEAGAFDAIQQPVDPARLSASIARTTRMLKILHERDALRELVDQQAQEFNALYTVGKLISGLLDTDEILRLVVTTAVNLTRAEEGSLFLQDLSTGELFLRAQHTQANQTTHNLRTKVNDTLIGRVLSSQRPVMLGETDLRKIQTSLLIKALLAVPLLVGDKAIGALLVTHQTSARLFGRHDVHLLTSLADAAAIAIENARLFRAAEGERAKLEAILRGLQDIIIVTDDELHILLFNDAARAGFGLDDTMLGQSLAAIGDLRPLLDLFEQRHSDERVWRTDISLPDNRILQGQLSPLSGVGYGAVLRDITRLKELDRIKTEFVSIVSHDLRTPLTAIRGYVSLLPRVGPLNDMQQDFVRRVELSMDNIVDLIADLLDIGKIEAGVDWEMSRVLLQTVVQTVVDRLQPNLEMHQHILTNELPELPPVLGNARRLEQVVNNLVGNAIKYTPYGGQIGVQLSEDGDFIVLRVLDSGIGISREDQRRVFDKFYRVESAATDKISGTGLGLSIVKAIVKKHSGRVWVESELGKGSIFTVLLPKYSRGED